MAEDGREDEFTSAILQLQVLHNSRVQELKIKYEEQSSFNTAATAEAKDLRDVVKRLKSAISASKIKIAQQARVISEQKVLLRRAGCPHAFVLSDAGRISKDSETRSSGKTPRKETLLNSGSMDLFNSNHQWSDSWYQDQPAPHNESCGKDKFPDSEQTVLPCDQREAELDKKASIPREWNSLSNRVESRSELDRTQNDIQSNPSSSFSHVPLILEENSCHIIYSHTHTLNPLQKPVELVSSAVRHGQRTGSPSLTAALAARYPARGLSLRGSRNSSRVRYRNIGQGTTSRLLTSSHNRSTNYTREGNDNHSSTNEEALDSTSPSFLAGSASRLVQSFDGRSDGERVDMEGDNENPLELEDEPMSCSMFATCPQDTTGSTTTKMAGATLHQITLANAHSVIPRKHPAKVNQIAELLSTRKRSRTVSSLDSFMADGEMMHVVPVTPGTRLVRNILDSEGWLAAQSPPKRGSRLGKSKKEGEDTGRREDGRGYFIRQRVSVDDGRLLTASSNGQQQKRAAEASAAGGKDGAGPNTGNVQRECGDENRTASDQILTNQTEHRPQVATTVNALVGGAKQSTTYDTNEDAMRMAQRTGLLTNYKCDTKILKKADRDKLDAKACPDCGKWFESDDAHGDMRAHLRNTCRHKALHLPPDSDPRMWDISFPSTEECDKINM